MAHQRLPYRITQFWVTPLSLVLVHPRYVEQVWNLEAISGTLIAGVPVEEFLFAYALGFLWSSAYEHAAWRAYDRDGGGTAGRDPRPARSVHPTAP
jgi:hypothetical protein